MSGLVSIPIANEYRDGEVMVGVNYFDKLNNSFGSFAKDGYSYNFAITFIPEIEFGGKISRNVHEGNNQGIGDRTISFRIRPFLGNEYLPAVVIGWQNIGAVFGGEGAVHQHSVFIVASKSLMIFQQIGDLSLHIGYGGKIIEAGSYQFQGLFGGIKVGTKIFTNNVRFSVMVEYDSTYFNSGIKLKLFEHIYFLGGLLDMRYFSGGGGFYIQL
jgi:hypothetical protein